MPTLEQQQKEMDNWYRQNTIIKGSQPNDNTNTQIFVRNKKLSDYGKRELKEVAEHKKIIDQIDKKNTLFHQIYEYVLRPFFNLFGLDIDNVSTGIKILIIFLLAGLILKIYRFITK